MTLPDRYPTDTRPVVSKPPPHQVLSKGLRRLLSAGALAGLLASCVLGLVGLESTRFLFQLMALVLIAQVFSDRRYRAGWADGHEAGQGDRSRLARLYLLGRAHGLADADITEVVMVWSQWYEQSPWPLSWAVVREALVNRSLGEPWRPEETGAVR